MSIGTLTAAVAKGAAKSKIQHTKKMAKLLLATVLCSVVSAAFLLAAVTIVLSDAFGIIVACLVMAGIFLSGALIALYVMKSAQSKTTLAEPAKLVAAEAVKSSPKPILMLSLAAIAGGFILSRFR